MDHDVDRNQLTQLASPELHPSWHSSALAESRAACRSKAKSCRRGFAMRHWRVAPLASHPPATKLGPGSLAKKNHEESKAKPWDSDLS